MASVRTIMHVDLDAFFVAVELARNPGLRGKPVIVGGDPDGRGVVSTASYEARAYGVASGMALRTARRLCPQAVLLRGDFREYARVSQRFHQILRDYSPLAEPVGLDEAFLDLTGCQPIIEARCSPGTGTAGDSRPFGSRPTPDMARVAGEEIRRGVKEELSLTASVGVAGGKSVAKVASDAAKPDGLLVVPAGDEAAFLAQRPVRDLAGVGPKAEAQLALLGVRTLGQLAAVPASRLRSLFGKWGPVLAERAQGIDPTPVACEREAARSVSREGTYARDVGNVSVLRAALRRYAESLGAELRRTHRSTRCVTLKLRYGDFTTITRSRTLERPTHADGELYRTAAELLERTVARDGRAVRLIGLGASNLVDDAVQLHLFDRREFRLETLLRSIDRLRAKYGHRCLQTGLTFFDPCLPPDTEPERLTGLSPR